MLTLFIKPNRFLKPVKFKLLLLLSIFIFIGIAQADDNWYSVSSSHFQLFYKQSDSMYVSNIIRFSEEALTSISSDFSFDSKDSKIGIFLCDTEKTFAKLTQNAIPDWGVGCAIPHSNVIVLKSPKAVKHSLNLREIIAHEYTHIILAQIVGENQRLPHWLNEGIAMYKSQNWKFSETSTLAQASLFGNLIPLGLLDDNFPFYESMARLAYAESFSAVNYIVERYGKDGLKKLVYQFKTTVDGVPIDTDLAFYNTFGIKFADFESDWLKMVNNKYKWISLFTNSIIFWILITFIFLVGYIMKRRRMKKKLDEMEEWE